MGRSNQLPLSAFTRLDHACQAVTEAFGSAPMHVGSSAGGPDAHPGYRDVDVRLVLADEEYDALFVGRPPEFWSLLCWSISEHLAGVSGLPVDFQVQRRTEANAEYADHWRNPLGGRRHRRLYAAGPPESTTP